jgi:hypothetical protein
VSHRPVEQRKAQDGPCREERIVEGRSYSVQQCLRARRTRPCVYSLVATAMTRVLEYVRKCATSTTSLPGDY